MMTCFGTTFETLADIEREMASMNTTVWEIATQDGGDNVKYQHIRKKKTVTLFVKLYNTYFNSIFYHLHKHYIIQIDQTLCMININKLKNKTRTVICMCEYLCDRYATS